jgi:thymidine kinase
MHEFVLFVGSMGSGKTSSLLAYVDRAKYQKRSVLAFKPARDDRYDNDAIVSHGGWKVNAKSVNHSRNIMDHVIRHRVDRSDVVALDEAFMLKGSADVMIDLFKQGHSIVVSSLDMSYKCEPFEEIKQMMPWATRVQKLSAVCVNCGADAYYTHKKTWGEATIEVGGLDEYQPLCFSCHPVLQRVV